MKRQRWCFIPCLKMVKIMELHQLLRDKEASIIFSTLAGSLAYGTNTAESDEDIRGIYITPAIDYLKLDQPDNQVSDERNDIVYYSLRRFCELAANANPNILELLYMPDDCIKKTSKWMDFLIESRDLFITKQCVDTHIGYAQAQIKKAKGKNKWVNNPQPKQAPLKEQFCWFIPDNSETKSFPVRPIPLADTKINLSEYHCASIEHTVWMYRLYHYGRDAKGVFRGDMLVCESIPKQDEVDRFSGILIFNEPAWQQALKEHTSYWQWINNRNNKRWQKQEAGEMDYDAKNMMHTIRLLLSGESILNKGKPIVRVDESNLKLLTDIRDGKYQYNDLIDMAEGIISRTSKLKKDTDLIEKADLTKVNNLLTTITLGWQEENLCKK